MGCSTGTDIEECSLLLCITVIKMLEDDSKVDMVWVYVRLLFL
jgi:hypothetical protein